MLDAQGAIDCPLPPNPWQRGMSVKSLIASGAKGVLQKTQPLNPVPATRARGGLKWF